MMTTNHPVEKQELPQLLPPAAPPLVVEDSDIVVSEALGCVLSTFGVASCGGSVVASDKKFSSVVGAGAFEKAFSAILPAGELSRIGL